MHELQVYGSSDDRIGVSGHVSEEFYAQDYAEPHLLGFSNGVVLGVRYAGEWSIRGENVPDDAEVVIHPAGSDEGPVEYSDTAVVRSEEPVEWILSGDRLEKFEVEEESVERKASKTPVSLSETDGDEEDEESDHE